MSSASYIAGQIIRGYNNGGYENGGLPYFIVIPDSFWSKYQGEVDQILKDKGYEFLIEKDLQE